jgi:hypothetical protein
MFFAFTSSSSWKLMVISWENYPTIHHILVAHMENERENGGEVAELNGLE